jgi:intracellular multiplication protein IcmJ
MQVPLELHIGGAQWSNFTIRSKDPKFAPFAQSIFQRDNYTCQYCSFRAFNDMTVVNKDGNYTNNSPENMMTACQICIQCLFIDAVGRSGVGGGQLIYLPEISQNDLNGICHALFCAMSLNTNSRSKAESIYNSFKLRSMCIEKEWMSGLSNPSFMGQMLLDTPLQDKDNVQKFMLSALRLLPSYEGFAHQIKSWIEPHSPSRSS